MKKCIFKIMIFFLIFLFAAPITYASDRVVVTIPQFNVTINDITFVDNDYDRYPLLLYKNITYFPLTYYKANLLNLNMKWSSEEGLEISKGNPQEPKLFYYDGFEKYNSKTQKAIILNSKIIINNNEINNCQETYPILQFRDIIYLPLTYSYAQEFGWNYQFDNNSGLIVSTNNFYFIGNMSAYYRMDDLLIQMTTYISREGPRSANLTITKKDDLQETVGINESFYFGYFQKNGPIFTVKNGEIYTTYLNAYDDKLPKPCRISIDTIKINT